MVESIRWDLISFTAARVTDGKSVDADTDLIESELLDSLLVMDLIAHIEGRYGIRLENTEIAPRNFRTIGALAELVAGKKQT